MRKIYAASIIALSFLVFYGCHEAYSTMFYTRIFPPTQSVQVFIDSPPTQGYDEIGRVVAEGGVTVSYQTLLNDAIQEAKAKGADGLIKVETYTETEYDSNGNPIEKPRVRAIMIRFKPGQ